MSRDYDFIRIILHVFSFRSTTRHTAQQYDQVGEIVVKSPLVMACYLGDQQATDTAIIELPGRGYGWYRTGVLTIDFFG